MADIQLKNSQGTVYNYNGITEITVPTTTGGTVTFNEGGITPTGNIDITMVGTTDVAKYATATVLDANLTPANIVENVQILGVTGSHVDIPNIATEAAMAAFNIDENIGRICKFTGTTGIYVQNRYYVVQSSTGYTITYNLTNCTGAGTNPTIIAAGGSATLNFSTTAQYILPDSITVTGATSVYSAELGTVVLSNPTDNVVITIDAELNYLCLTNFGAGSEISMEVVGTVSTLPTLEYSRNKTDWTTFTVGSTTVILGDNYDKIYMRGTNATFSVDSDNYIKFVMLGNIHASGNVMSLLDATCASVTMPSGGFVGLFYGCDVLYTAPVLPATALANYCYYSMFNGCVSLTEAPVLPATTLANYCYSEMFSECETLTSAPTLPAMTMTNGCYSYMFYGCHGLAVAPALPATTLYDSCYEGMFYSCAGLISASTLPALDASASCYESMFRECVSLRTVPALPATQLHTDCYRKMFSGCTDLTVADASGTGYTVEWRIPTEGVNTLDRSQELMFEDCLGTRASDDLSIYNTYKVFYTYNTPV